MERLRSRNDLLSGLLMLALGFTFAWFSSRLNFGSVAQMGAGFVPTLLSWGLVAIGAILVLRSPYDRELSDEWPTLRALLVVCLAPLVFGALIRVIGFVLTVIVTALLARLAMPGRPGWVDLVSALALAAFCALTFVVFLSQSLPLWP